MKKSPELTVVTVETPVIEITTKRYEQLIAAEKEMQLLKYIQGSNPVDVSKLPTEDELRAIYEKDPLFTHFDSIFLGYQKKIDLLTAKNFV
jgi:hypothetical protein